MREKIKDKEYSVTATEKLTDSIIEALKEIRKIKEGKLDGRPVRDLLKEL